MKKYLDFDKRMSMKVAVSKFVNSSESFIYANCLTGMRPALTHALISTTIN